MGKRIAKVLDISGEFSETPDFPVAVVREQAEGEKHDGGRKYVDPNTGEVSIDPTIVDPIFDYHVTKNLFGRIMTLVEATTDMHKLNAVKDLFAKELRNWEYDVYRSASELADGGNSSNNIYTKNSLR